MGIWLPGCPGFKFHFRAVHPKPEPWHLLIGAEPKGLVSGEFADEGIGRRVFDNGELTPQSFALFLAGLPTSGLDINTIPFAIEPLSVSRNADWRFRGRGRLGQS